MESNVWVELANSPTVHSVSIAAIIWLTIGITAWAVRR